MADPAPPDAGVGLLSETAVSDSDDSNGHDSDSDDYDSDSLLRRTNMSATDEENRSSR